MKKLLLILIAYHIFVVNCPAQARWNERYQQYIIAIEQMLKWKIPASITLAQGLFESGAGQSELAVKGNNHFGIKCNGWNGRKVYHDDDARNECFRAYNNAFESYEDHSRFLSGSKRYASLFNLKTTDYKGWAKGLKAAGYATNPQYANKLIEIIQLYKLYQYDTAKGYDKFQTQQVKNGDLRHIYAFNKNYYLIARKGDTFRSIAKEVDVSYRKLAKYNERNKNDKLEEGEIVWLKKKRSKAGESMYSISQRYGIRLKKLYKINNLPPDYQIRVGEAIRLR